MAYPYDLNDDLMSQVDEEFDADKEGQALVAADPQSQIREAQSALSMPAVKQAEADKVDRHMAAQALAEEEKSQNNHKSKYDSLLGEYKKLQEDRQKQQNLLGYLAASQQIGQSIAGKHSGDFKADTSGIDMLNKMADRPVQDYTDNIKQQDMDMQLREAQEDRDPFSPKAIQARQLAKSRGYKISDDMSYSDVVKVLKTGDPLKNSLDQQSFAQGQQKLQLGAIDLSDADRLRNAKDPTASVAQAFAIKAGLSPEVVKGKSRWELEGLLKLYKETQGASETFLPQSETDPLTGQTTISAFSNRTGKLTPTGSIKGFAPKLDLNTRTGEKETFIPGLAKSIGSTYAGATEQSPEQADLLIPEVTMQQLPKNKQDQVLAVRDKFLADTKDERASLQASKSIQDLLAAGKAIDGDIMRAVQNKFSIATGNKGATSENDVTPFGGRQAILDRIQRQLGFWVKGEFTDDDRKFLSDLANVMKKSSENELQRSTEFFSNNLYKDLKADPNVKAKAMTQGSAEQLIGADVYTKPDSNLVDVITKSGKKMKMPKENVEKARAKGLIQ